jgi:hypothetical protein
VTAESVIDGVEVDKAVGAGCCGTPNPNRYAGQRIFVVRRENYVYLVPFVEDEHTVFLKTIIPSRKATKQYVGEESEDET